MGIAHRIGFINTSINLTGSAYIRQAQYTFGRLSINTFPIFRKNINEIDTFNGVLVQSSGMNDIFILSGHASFAPSK
jgi:hypothetical protein